MTSVPRSRLDAAMHPPLVLAYHGLGRYSRAHDPHNLMVDPARFRSQIDTLRARGYRFVTLSDFGAAVARGQAPAGACALTFDDGSLDNLTVLAPLLEELGLPATVFACSGLLGRPHFSFPPEAQVRLMDADELRALAEVPGVQIGSHTVTHADLAMATADEAHTEMAASKAALEDLLHRDVETFAYPRCAYSPACPQAARDAGYRIAVTCGARGGWSAFELTRESIDSLDTRIGFAVKSRRLFWPLRNSLPGRVSRRAVRGIRHG